MEAHGDGLDLSTLAATRSSIRGLLDEGRTPDEILEIIESAHGVERPTAAIIYEIGAGESEGSSGNP